jgi:LysR family nitrogen assimilation transcriptional regulator
VELTQLRNFIEVAERGSFTHAAVALGLNQPALSRQIRRLELELHKSLLYRHGRGVRLTDAGERFATTARNVLHQLHVAAQTVPAPDTGRITIGLPPTFGRLLTVRLVRAFAAHYPRARITIVEGFSCHLRERLGTGEIDIALVHDPADETPGAWETVVNEPLCLVVPKSRDDGPAATVTLAEVAMLPLIFPSAPNPVRAIIEKAAARCGFLLDAAQEIDTIETTMELVQNGFGYAIAPPVSIQNTQYVRTLQLRRIVEPDMYLTLSLASSCPEPHAPLHGKAMALLKDVVAQAMADC